MGTGPRLIAPRSPSRALRVLVAMSAETEQEVLPAHTLGRLAGVANILDVRVRRSFTESIEARASLADADVLLTGWGCPPISPDIVDLAPRLRAIVHAAGTLKTFIDPAVFDRDLVISSAAQANAVPVAEFTFAAIVFSAKRAFTLRDQLREHGRRRDLTSVPPLGCYGETVGVVGASRIGRLVINRLRTLDVRVLVHDPYLSEHEAHELGVERCDLPELFSQSQIVTLHAPLLPETEGMVSSELLALMPDHAVLINTARGGLVDTTALTRECVAGRLDAVLDVSDPEPLPLDSPLYRRHNVFITPHIAGALGNEVARLGELAVTEIVRLHADLPPEHAVYADDLARIA